MQTTSSGDRERRINGAARLPLDALVEVGIGTEGAFEAQAIDVSSKGMHLRTAYLPELGQPVSCRFEAGSQTIIAEGRVAWCQDLQDGGEFGLEFLELDEASRNALDAMLRGPEEKVPGTRVRLHIEGLGSPMRARVRQSAGTRVTAFSELGFLQVGKGLELEDATNGFKRPAEIETVDVELDPNSKVPQLVVSMRYADVADAADAAPASESHGAEARRTMRPKAPALAVEGKETTPEPSTIEGGEEPRKEEGDFEAVKSPFARTMAKVTPALIGFAGMAKLKAAELLKRKPQSDAAPPARRTTAPPPGGALHAAGRRMRRDPVEVVASGSNEEAASSGAPIMATAMKHKRKIALGAAVLLASTLGIAAMRKGDAKDPNKETAALSASADSHAATAPAPSSLALSMPQPVAGNPNMAGLQGMPTLPGINGPGAVNLGSPGSDDSADEEPTAKGGKPQPFGSGNVTQGTTIHLKMDGNIERIQGAMQPTGFTVVLPKRKSLTSASAITKQDKRIAQTKVINDGNGTELSISFKDGVPPYVVRAKKDILEVVLGKPGDGGGDDKADKPSAKGGKHSAHGGSHKKHDTKHGKKKSK
jgi:hypothetical protein